MYAISCFGPLYSEWHPTGLDKPQSSIDLIAFLMKFFHSIPMTIIFVTIQYSSNTKLDIKRTTTNQIHITVTFSRNKKGIRNCIFYLKFYWIRLHKIQYKQGRAYQLQHNNVVFNACYTLVLKKFILASLTIKCVDYLCGEKNASCSFISWDR